MIWQKFIFCAVFLILFPGISFAQADNRNKTVSPSTKQIAPAVKFSSAYAEILLRQTERESQLEEFLLDYTEEFPKVKEIKFELELLQKQMNKMLAVPATEVSKLSIALGKLMVRKTELEVNLWNLLRQYNADHPEVRRAKRKIEVYEKAVREILP